MSKLFTTWVFNGVRYLALHRTNDVVVVDEYGGNYGSLMDVDRFRKYQQDGSELAKPLSWKCAELQTRLVEVKP